MKSICKVGFVSTFKDEPFGLFDFSNFDHIKFNNYAGKIIIYIHEPSSPDDIVETFQEVLMHYLEIIKEDSLNEIQE